MKLLYIRHGESANNHLYFSTGSDQGRDPDPDLTERGQRQARALAARLTDGSYPRVTHLYSSLMRRTIQTAAPLADALDLPIIARTDSYEIPGPYAGPHATRVAHAGSPRSLLAGITERVVLPEVATEEGWFRDELEEAMQSRQRAQRLLAKLRAEHGDDDVVALVSHGAFGGVLLGAALGTKPDVWFGHNNTGTTLLSWQQPSPESDSTAPDAVGAVMLWWQNRLDHLADGERS